MHTGQALLPLTLVSLAQAFSFAHNAPAQCAPFTVQWSGGAPPFSLLLVPVFDNPRNITVPADAKGSYTLPLPLRAGQQFVVAMSDATGFGTGGVSALLNVGGAPAGAAACDTSTPPVAFQFQLNALLQQCAPYPITGYDAAVQPVTITALIPLGKSFQFHPNAGSSSFVWDPVNVRTGTGIVFFLADAAGRFGGSSHINQVGSSPNSACINDQSPASTASAEPTFSGPATSTTATSTKGAPPAPSTSAPGGDAPPAPTATAPPARRISAGTIGGAVVGAFIVLLVLGTLLSFWYQQYRTRRDQRRFATRRGAGAGPPPAPPGAQPLSANPLLRVPPPQQWTTFPAAPHGDYVVEPWMAQPHPYAAAGGPPPAPASPWADERAGPAPYAPAPSPYPYPLAPSPGPYPPSPSPASYASHGSTPYARSPSPTPYASSSAPAPAAAAASSSAAPWDDEPSELPYKSKTPPPAQRPTRLILHTDAEEEIELPPQYSDRGQPRS